MEKADGKLFFLDFFKKRTKSLCKDFQKKLFKIVILFPLYCTAEKTNVSPSVAEISKYKNSLLTPSEAKKAAQLKLYQQKILIQKI